MIRTGHLVSWDSHLSSRCPLRAIHGAVLSSGVRMHPCAHPGRGRQFENRIEGMREKMEAPPIRGLLPATYASSDGPPPASEGACHPSRCGPRVDRSRVRREGRLRRRFPGAGYPRPACAGLVPYAFHLPPSKRTANPLIGTGGRRQTERLFRFWILLRNCNSCKLATQHVVDLEVRVWTGNGLRRCAGGRG